MAGSTQAEIPSQFGGTAVVTGATGGLGYETALVLAKAGSEVILTGRDDGKGRSAIEKISREVTSAKVSYEHLDPGQPCVGRRLRAADERPAVP
jgi:short-subunit dehydrogenase